MSGKVGPVAAMLFAIVASGCASPESSSGPVPQATQAPLVATRGSVSGDLYVSNAPGPTIDCDYWISVYRAGTGSMIQKLPGDCNGDDDNNSVAFDKDDDLYWADWVNREVRVYAPGKSSPWYTIKWGFTSPAR